MESLFTEVAFQYGQIIDIIKIISTATLHARLITP